MSACASGEADELETDSSFRAAEFAFVELDNAQLKTDLGIVELDDGALSFSTATPRSASTSSARMCTLISWPKALTSP